MGDLVVLLPALALRRFVAVCGPELDGLGFGAGFDCGAFDCFVFGHACFYLVGLPLVVICKGLEVFGDRFQSVGRQVYRRKFKAAAHGLASLIGVASRRQSGHVPRSFSQIGLR